MRRPQARAPRRYREFAGPRSRHPTPKSAPTSNKEPSSRLLCMPQALGIATRRRPSFSNIPDTDTDIRRPISLLCLFPRPTSPRPSTHGQTDGRYASLTSRDRHALRCRNPYRSMHPFSVLTLGIFVAGYITARWDLVTRLYELAIFAWDNGVVVSLAHRFRCNVSSDLTRLSFSGPPSN